MIPKFKTITQTFTEADLSFPVSACAVRQFLIDVPKGCIVTAVSWRQIFGTDTWEIDVEYGVEKGNEPC